MSKIIFTLFYCCFLFLLGCRGGQGDRHQVVDALNSATQEKAKLYVGYESVRPLFKKLCSECHNKMGLRDWLDETVANQSKKNILNRTWKMRESAAGMPVRGSKEGKLISESDRELIKNWALSTTGPQKVPREPTSPLKQISLYDKMENNCFGCHGNNGISSQASVPNLAGQGKEYLITQLKAFKSYNEGDKLSVKKRKNFAMNTVAKELSREEIVFIANYYSNLNPEVIMDPDKEWSRAESLLIERGRIVSLRDDVSCNSCHLNDRGWSQEPSMFPTIAGQKSLVLMNSMEDFGSERRSGLYMNTIIQDAVKLGKKFQNPKTTAQERAAIIEEGDMYLTEKDLKALAAYYSSLVPGVPIQDGND